VDIKLRYSGIRLTQINKQKYKVTWIEGNQNIRGQFLLICKFRPVAPGRELIVSKRLHLAQVETAHLQKSHT
jgi:hypothetical protein